MDRRTFLLVAFKALGFGLILNKLYYLQIVQRYRYLKLADKNRIREKLIAPQRGAILDSTGLSVAVDIPLYRICAKQAVQTNEQCDTVVLQDQLSWEEMAKLSTNLQDDLLIDKSLKRSYKYGESMSHITGYVNKQNQGCDGIEKIHNNVLSGEYGKHIHEYNAKNKLIRNIGDIHPINGNNIELTVNVQLQEYIYNLLAPFRRGSAVVMDNTNGEILALVSYPGYDPNNINADWSKLSAHKDFPLLNRVLFGLYAPGSIFKIFVALKALEDKIIDLNTKIYCKGYYYVNQHRFHCVQSCGHGSVDITQALRSSCDVFFFEIGAALGIDKITAIAIKFGFGENIDTGLQKSYKGRLPYKRNIADTIQAAIGQSTTLVTPLHIITAMARFVSKKKIAPHIIKDMSYTCDPINIEAQEIIIKALWQVTNDPHGSAYAYRDLAMPWTCIGKTSTVQVKSIAYADRLLGRLNSSLWEHKDHGMFYCAGPWPHLKFSVFVCCEHSGRGSSSAAPLAMKTMRFLSQMKLL